MEFILSPATPAQAGCMGRRTEPKRSREPLAFIAFPRARLRNVVQLIHMQRMLI